MISRLGSCFCFRNAAIVLLPFVPCLASGDELAVDSRTHLDCKVLNPEAYQEKLGYVFQASLQQTSNKKAKLVVFSRVDSASEMQRMPVIYDRGRLDLNILEANSEPLSLVVNWNKATTHMEVGLNAEKSQWVGSLTLEKAHKYELSCEKSIEVKN